MVRRECGRREGGRREGGRRERGRREFLAGAAGLGAGGSTFAASDRPAGPSAGASGVGVPGIDDDHDVRWTFGVDAERAVIYPIVHARGTLVTLVRTEDDGPLKYAVHAIDPETGDREWTRELDDRSTFPKAAAGGVYVADGNDLLALDVADGSERWRLRGGRVDHRDFAVGERAVFAARGARVTAIDATQGGELWTTEVRNNGYLRGLTLADERVYVGGQQGFYALDRETGREQWFSEVPGGETAWVAGVRGDLLVGWSDAAAYGLRVADGTRRWRTPHEPLVPHDSGGALGDDAVYLWGGTLAAVDCATGEKRWTYEPDGGRGRAPELHDGSVYFPAPGGDFVAVDADSGRERWRFDAGALRRFWGGAADGLVYVVGVAEAYAIDARSGSERWTLDFGDESGLWADVWGDLALVATREGTLYAVDRPSALATAPVRTAEEFATSPPGLGLLGLLGAGLLGAGYRRAKRRSRERGPDLTFGRLDRLGGGPVTETYRKRIQTPDGPRLVAETCLTADANPETRRAFGRAVERWADLDADGVLPIRDYEVGSGTDRPWFETPYAASGSLADAWPLAQRDRVEAASGVARALHAAHREGVSHGRLAPRHVFLDAADGLREPRITGGEVLVGGWFVDAALAGVRNASDPYVPPESGRDRSVAVRGDVYRVAALAYHLLTGTVPDPGPVSVTARSPALAEELDAVLARALAADPDERYGTALAFDDEFRWAAIDR